MTLCFNLVDGSVTLSLYDRVNLATPVPLKGGQIVGVTLQFHANGVPTPPPTGSAFLLGVKPSGKFDGEYLCSASTWSATSDTSIFTAQLNANTTAIETALNVDGNPSNDIPSTAAQAELQYWPPGAALPTKSQTFPVQIYDWVNQGDEGETGAAAPPFDARLSKLEFQVGQFSFMPGVTGLTGGGTGNLDGQTTAGLANPRLALMMVPSLKGYLLVNAAPIAITSVSVGNPAIVATSAPHGLQTGWNVTIAGFTDGTPIPNGTYVVTVIDSTHFSIPLNVTAAPTSSGTSAVATSSPAVILPTDYNASSNPVAWYNVL